MKILKRYNLEQVRNRSEELVFKKIEELMAEREDICGCESCVLDLTAYTLNHVTPLYGASLLGSLHSNRGGEIQEEIDEAVEEGLKRIAENPHHEEQ